MKQYICNIVSTAGKSGEIITKDPQSEDTRQLLERGIIREVKVEQPEETKAPRKRKVKE